MNNWFSCKNLLKSSFFLNFRIAASRKSKTIVNDRGYRKFKKRLKPTRSFSFHLDKRLPTGGGYNFFYHTLGNFGGVGIWELTPLNHYEYYLFQYLMVISVVNR
jgi:hypothetical protein